MSAYCKGMLMGCAWSRRSPPVGRADAPTEAITHSFLATGQETYILDDDGKVVWHYPAGHARRLGAAQRRRAAGRDQEQGLPRRCGRRGHARRQGRVRVQGNAGSEVNTVQAVGDNILLTEAGDKPRLLEVDRTGKIVVEVPLQAQTKDHHLQTRMARKLANGNYLVPQLLDKVVREYTPEGKIVWEVKTPNCRSRPSAWTTATRSSTARSATWLSRWTRTARRSGS